MHVRFISTLMTIAALSAASASAQDVVLTSPELNASGQAYLEAIDGRRIASNVSYYDPTAAAPALDTQARLESLQSSEDANRVGADLDWPLGILAAAIIAGIVFLFARFGGNTSIMLQPTSDNPNAIRRSTASLRRSGFEAQPRNLAEITGIADRRVALILLTQNALRKVTTANGLLLQQSWTDREALRRIPADQRHLTALKELVFTSERVQFGGRDVSEPEFVHHVTQMTPLFREMAS